MVEVSQSGERGIDDGVLDAARDCVLAYGVRRTTLTDVARRAGVSRMTVYRRWPDVQSLIGDLMSREWHQVLMATAADEGEGPARARVVARVVAGARLLREHPLLCKIRDVDPEVLLPYLLDRRGNGQDEMLRFLAAALADGRTDGSIRSGDAGVMARAVFLTTQSFVLSVRTVADTVPATEFDQELARLVDGYLRPD
ncbi:TetR/AcrR family transcriptional regulator [Micromonospora sp. WMMD558]|uniref:TetR/AcrR family transcriptional regulator n=1 Tax=unclassified Micromonospora TaxID=2617518 RepID=UPI0012B4A6D7|nr:TetR/AcrR family transcriptional regulator [Micromonospora sp. WMMC415]QGN48262.1 TetR family transcriptional regulator [Micromonospora sp. WMMC415]